MTLMFNRRFINETMTDLVSAKIHTIRQNYEYWKKQDGKEVSIRVWSGKPYRSKQIEICKKTIVSVQKVTHFQSHKVRSITPYFMILGEGAHSIKIKALAKNDGFESVNDFSGWFFDYPDGEMAILHFTDYRY